MPQILRVMIKRIFEVLPAVLAWSTILLPILFLKEFPFAVSVFILLYVFLWFLRAVEYSFFLVFSFVQYKKALRKNWREKRANIPKTCGLDPSQVIHLVIIPTYKENIEVLQESIGSLANADFPKKQIFFCLATEKRDKENGRKNARILQEEWKDRIGRFYWVEHPDDLPDEIPGKGANISFAAKTITKKLENEGIDFQRVLITTLDADNKVHKDLFSALTIEYCTRPERHRRAFQPMPFFFNNIWEVPTLNRIVALSSSFWHLIEAGRPDRLRNFSSHSQPLTALAEMDYWDKNTIVEDGRQYWRSYLHFEGKYDVVPIFLPVYQDAIMSKTFFRSLRGQFQQLRRWAWGSSDIAYFTLGILKKKGRLPVVKTTLQYYRLVEGHYMWATAALFLFISTFSGRILNPGFTETVFGSHLSVILSTLFQVALLGILVSMILTFLFVPPPPKKRQIFGLIWQWALFPIATICFGCFPALVTQTQMAFGRDMKFHVTKKIRKKTD
jgi:cellulose synthase/poly-beta-1,6-N-acetylglucosamine synthase-like glycosyltransferase